MSTVGSSSNALSVIDSLLFLCRYPDDKYDRRWWSFGVSGIPTVGTVPDSSLLRDLFYIPTKVMQETWSFPNDINTAASWILYRNEPAYMPPAETYLVVAYAFNPYAAMTQSIGLQFKSYETKPIYPNKTAIFTIPYFVVDNNTIILSTGSNSSLSNLNVNAFEIYGQYSYNFSATGSDGK
jgi:hypothetical protein